MSEKRVTIPAINPEIPDAIGRITVFDALKEADATLEQHEQTKRQLEESERQNGIDHMTGLQNKGPYDRRVEEIKRQLGGEGRRDTEVSPDPVVIIAIDAIGLKKINEDKVNGGKKAGDALITRVADTLKENFRNEDLYRDGGDEFTGFFSVSAEKLPRFLSKVTDMALANERVFRTGIRIAYEGSDVDMLIDEADPKKHEENKINSVTCQDNATFVEQLLKR